MEESPQRILFVCGKNLRRSPTAAAIFRNHPGLEVRSAGVSEKSRHRITEADLRWADLVLVMERKHAARIRESFGTMNPLPPIRSLDIPDDYEFMDPELVELLRGALEQ